MILHNVSDISFLHFLSSIIISYIFNLKIQERNAGQENMRAECAEMEEANELDVIVKTMDWKSTCYFVYMCTVWEAGVVLCIT